MFQAENTEYCIHRSLVEIHAPDWLRDLEGSIEPIALENVTTSELDALLCIMYPTYVCPPLSPSLELNVSHSDICRRDLSAAADWTSVLRLATRWHFASFRTLALQNLEPIASPLQKLLLARELDIPHWLLPGHIALCMREELLSLGEMQLLPLQDVHLIVTVRERLHTSKIAATIQGVSQHIQSLSTASIEAFTPNPAANIIPMFPDKHLPVFTPFLSPDSPTTVPIVAVAEDAVEANCPPTEIVFDAKAMKEALEDVAFDRVVASISPENSEEASRVLVEWAADGCKAPLSSTNTLQGLVYAFARRCARDVSFSGMAADTLASFVDRAEGPPSEQCCASSGKEHCRLGDCMRQEFSQVATLVLEASSWQSDHAPSSDIGKVLCGPTERWLAHSDFTLRLHNCTVFIGGFLRAGLISESLVTNAIKTNDTKLLYSRLLALGHHLDSAGPSLDALLKELDDMCLWLYTNQTNQSLWLVQHREWMTVSILLPPHQDLPLSY
jgi:hypothetical protein